MRARRAPAPRAARGIVILAVLVVVLVLLAGWMLYSALPDNPRLAADARAGATLSQARDAVIGHARSRWCLQPTGSVVDHLPCPDVGGGEGIAPAACAPGAVGRLPWATLGLGPLRDGAGECLWYRRTATGAEIIAAGSVLGAQSRAGVPAAPACGGHYGVAAYLEPSPLAGAAANDIVLAIGAGDLAAPTGCGP
ncbi:MAG: hypothetical protein ACOY37_10555 [Pseudomonadota bacterium]